MQECNLRIRDAASSKNLGDQKRWLFSESVIRFSNLQIPPKNIFQKTILGLKFKFPANNSKVFWAGNLNSKIRIVFWIFFF